MKVNFIKSLILFALSLSVLLASDIDLPNVIIIGEAEQLEYSSEKLSIDTEWLKISKDEDFNYEKKIFIASEPEPVLEEIKLKNGIISLKGADNKSATFRAVLSSDNPFVNFSAHSYYHEPQKNWESRIAKINWMWSFRNFMINYSFDYNRYEYSDINGLEQTLELAIPSVSIEKSKNTNWLPAFSEIYVKFGYENLKQTENDKKENFPYFNSKFTYVFSGYPLELKVCNMFKRDTPGFNYSLIYNDFSFFKFLGPSIIADKHYFYPSVNFYAELQLTNKLELVVKNISELDSYGTKELINQNYFQEIIHNSESSQRFAKTPLNLTAQINNYFLIPVAVGSNLKWTKDFIIYDESEKTSLFEQDYDEVIRSSLFGIVGFKKNYIELTNRLSLFNYRPKKRDFVPFMPEIVNNLDFKINYQKFQIHLLVDILMRRFDLQENELSDVSLADLHFKWNISDYIQLTAGINNILNESYNKYPIVDDSGFELPNKIRSFEAGFNFLF